MLLDDIITYLKANKASLCTFPIREIRKGYQVSEPKTPVVICYEMTEVDEDTSRTGSLLKSLTLKFEVYSKNVSKTAVVHSGYDVVETLSKELIDILRSNYMLKLASADVTLPVTADQSVYVKTFNMSCYVDNADIVYRNKN